MNRLQCHTASENRTKTGAKWSDNCESLTVISDIRQQFHQLHIVPQKNQENKRAVTFISEGTPTQSCPVPQTCLDNHHPILHQLQNILLTWNVLPSNFQATGILPSVFLFLVPTKPGTPPVGCRVLSVTLLHCAGLVALPSVLPSLSIGFHTL